MHTRLFLIGFGIWLGATVALRLAGQFMLRPKGWLSVVVLFAISFPLMALLARGLCRDSHLPSAEWPRGAISLVLPTLLLDPFSSAFFPVIFPNMDPRMAGVFGGWILCCCAGAMAGALMGLKRGM